MKEKAELGPCCGIRMEEGLVEEIKGPEGRGISGGTETIGHFI